MAALLALVACQAEEAPAEPDPIRIALFNIKELQTSKLSQLDATGRGHHPQLLAAAQIIAQVRPDVLVVQEIDRPPGPDGTRPAEVFYESYIQQAWPDVNLVHLFAGPSNTGTLSGLDLNGDGHVATTADEGDRRHGDDSYGFGTYPGQYSMAVYSRWPLAIDEIRTFQNLLWKDLPGHHMPQDFFAPEVEGALRLSSKSHWDIPVVLESGARLHLWVSHPTPPVFDGDEDKNGRRNHDEIRFWKLYASGDSALTDDAGSVAPRSDAPFVIVGDLNARPGDTENPSYDGGPAIEQLLGHPAVQDSGSWTISAGGLAGREPGPPHFWERATTGFAEGARIDYVLPSTGLEVLGGGVMWPDPAEDPEGEARALKASDHRLVWIDLRPPTGSP